MGILLTFYNGDGWIDGTIPTTARAVIFLNGRAKMKMLIHTLSAVAKSNVNDN